MYRFRLPMHNSCFEEIAAGYRDREPVMRVKFLTGETEKKMKFWERRREKHKERIRKLYERHKRVHALLKEYGDDILHSENFQKTREHIQHGSMTVHSHCMDVARYSLLINKKLGLHCNQHDLIRGALLHDYFLYDWHDKEYLSQRKRLHGFHHPATALTNAEKEYELSDKQREIIKKHMWPLTIVPPTCQEAWVVTAADKFCSLRETVGLRKGHGKRAV